MGNLTTFEKRLVFLIVVWLVVGPLIAWAFAAPQVFLSAPYVLVFALVPLLSGLAGIARRLHL